MWTRGEIKSRAKASLKTNYWKAVLVALIAAVLFGGAGISIGAGGVGSRITTTTSTTTSVHPDPSNPNVLVIENGGTVTTIDGEEGYGEDDLEQHLNEIDALSGTTVVEESNVSGKPVVSITTFGLTEEQREALRAMAGPILAMAAIILLIVLVLVIVFDAFVLNPFEVGVARFFVRNLDEPALVAELAYGYDQNYKETVKTLFWRDLKVFLWSLLFVVPGIVKSLEYRMVPYLLADDPTMTSKEAFAQSREMMYGNKFKAFVLDLSFIGWHILGVLSLGLLEFFYIAPYVRLTNAALYDALSIRPATSGGAHYATESNEPSAPVLPTV